MRKDKTRNSFLFSRPAGGMVSLVLAWLAMMHQPLVYSQESTESPSPLVASSDLYTHRLRRETTEEQNLRRIRQIARNRGDDPTMLAHLVQLTRELPPTTAAKLFGQLAEDYLRAGQFNRAADVLLQLVDQYPDQPAATEGLVALVRLYSSSEVAYAQQPHSGPSATKPTSDNGLLVYALHQADKSLQQRPDLANDPALAFQTAVALRRSGRPKAARSRLTSLKHNPHSQPWHQCAMVETWLQGTREDTPPKPSVVCSRVDKRPRLDGKLDEPFWLTSIPVQLESTQVRLARDDEFLYVAILCQKTPGATYATDDRPRSHDADLSEHDQVRLSIDVDRDYATYFQLAVDHRGWTADACWLDAGWNPRWYVAAASDDATWTVEAAIAWSELADAPPESRHVWTLAVDRLAPKADSQTWVGMVLENPGPENFGLLIFD